MASAPVWTFYLADSDDLSNLGEITFEARNKSLSVGLNKAGSCSFELHLSSDLAQYIVPIKYCVIARKNGAIVWSGPIWNLQEDLDNEKIQVSANGWFQLLHKRYLDSQSIYSSQKRGAIALDLLAKANAQQFTYIHAGTNGDTNSVNINKTYERYANIGQEIEALSATEAGFDFEVDPQTRLLQIRAYNSYTDQTDVVFGYNWGPNNVANVQRTTDADEMANRIIVTHPNGATQADESAIQTEYRLFTKIINISESISTTLAAAIANAEVAINKYPRTLITFQPKLYGPDNVPSLFEDYDIGDKVYLTAHRHGVSIERQAVRVFGTTVSIDDNGNETLSSIQSTYNSSN